MGTRALLIAAVMLAMAPLAAHAQERRSNFIKPTAGTVPPPKKASVGTPSSGPLIDPETGRAISDGAGLAGSGATLSGANAQRILNSAEKLDDARTPLNPIWDHPLADPHADTRAAANKALDRSKIVGGSAAAVSLIGQAAQVDAACVDKGSSGSKCAELALSGGSSLSSLTGTLAESPVASGVGNKLQFAADLVKLQRNCTDPNAEYGSCVLSGFDTAMSAGAAFVPGGEAPAAAYSLAKSVLPGAVDEGGKWLLGQSPGAWLYDKIHGDDDKAAMEAASAAQSARLEQMRAQRRAQYQQNKANLEAKQQAYDAEQVRIEQQRLAQLEAQQRAQQQAASNQAFLGGLMNSLQPILGGVNSFGPCPDPAQCEYRDSYIPAYTASHGLPDPRTTAGSASSSPYSNDCGGIGPGTCR